MPYSRTAPILRDSGSAISGWLAQSLQVAARLGGEIGRVKDFVKDSAERLKQELSLYLTGFSEASENFDDSDRQRELLLLLDLVLGRFYGIEGGFWSPQNQFLAYGFPTAGKNRIERTRSPHAGTLKCVTGCIGARFEIRLPRREPSHPQSSTSTNPLA
jgi:hypothetical protein